MIFFTSQALTFLFNLLFFSVPLILWPRNYEIFEFNKMVTVYAFTIIICFTWVSKMILQRKVVFRRTILDIPLIIFLLSQLLSTLISLDMRVSLLGYYSRFNGGFLSLLCYSLLYWAFVSNINQKKSRKALFFLFASALLVSIYGILEHFGIDKHIWIQDVQERVFSTLGQPNWLAAWLVALLPTSFIFALNPGAKKIRFSWLLLSTIYFLTLLFTKSRSGILGFAVASLIFWGGTFIFLYRNNIEKNIYIKTFLLINSLFLILNLFIKTPWTPDIKKYFIQQKAKTEEIKTPQGPALEVGGTESGTIRKLVWQGAVDTWKNYPILGSGVETFALSFYQFRPQEHNLVSEWDFLYNKAHNEYLNFLTTTGTLGFLSYLTLITGISFTFIKIIFSFEKTKNWQNLFLSLSLFTGFVSILITNFFGFSVVAVNLQFFLFPAIAVVLSNEEDEEKAIADKSPKILIGLLAILTIYLLFSLVKYWLADYHYAQGKLYNRADYLSNARTHLLKAVKLSPKEALFWAELSENSAKLAIALNENEEKKQDSQKAVETTLLEIQKALSLSPNNLGIIRQASTIYISLGKIEIEYLLLAKDSLEKAVEFAPTDAKLYYNLGLIFSNTVDTNAAINTLKKAVDLKPNYSKARKALSILYEKTGERSLAKKELEYILNNIDPADEEAKERLDSFN